MLLILILLLPLSENSIIVPPADVDAHEAVTLVRFGGSVPRPAVYFDTFAANVGV
jgi:hypothetical protein